MNKVWRKFNALGTEVVLTAFLNFDQDLILEVAEKIILDFEKRFSRFIEGNELDRFNKSPGTEVEASNMMLELIALAKNYYADTKGVFDPTIIGSLEKVGYDKSFTKLTGEAGKNITKADQKIIKNNFSARHRLSDLKISGGKIIKPANFRLDLGGIGKGYIVDYLAEKVFGDIKDYWISAGGDLLLKGNNLPDTGWSVGVQDPREPEKETISIKTKGKKSGIATSGIIKRKGQTGDFHWHHIIDPATGLPVVNDILSVTAISASASRADIFAKTVLILGEIEGLKFIEKQKDSACIIFFKDRGPVFSKRAARYL